MNSRHVTIAAFAAIVATGIACKGADEEAALPALMIARFETEMKTILHDLKLAEETAYTIGDRYLELGELTGAYFTRPVPEKYELVLSDVSEEGYRAQITHTASGITCELAVGGSGGRGVPTCK
jgi:hypothetical protein